MITLAGLRTRKVVPQRSAAELDAMAAAGAVVAAALHAVREAAVAGESTLSLDRIAEAVIRDAGARPSFLGYHGYPASICTSVNDRVVHGIPSAAEILAPGDLVSVDCGAVLDGWHGDAAITFGVGTLNPADEALCQATKESLEAGIAAMTPGKRLTDVSHAIETGTHAAEAAMAARSASSRDTAVTASAGKCTWTRFCPTRDPRPRPAAGPGSVLAIEPMLTLGSRKTLVLDDQWTVTTADGSRAAHWEHTVAATEDGPRILTLG
ncbi:methionine aminopeptidase, type I [Mycobacterium xenopi 4042]|uniref:Methionine aminopeptidase n=1 Tax=Mycobacterium xenopi 4042 TaxID=1299334 RepID=X7YKU3_MYCXE|nr:methionine aminopeptidase, type I [Mycobacterium xenopi 4042]